MPEAGMQNIKIVTAEIAPGIHQISLEGSLDWTNFAQVEAALDDLFKKGIYKIVVNLRRTKYISSAGFGCFISSLDTAMKKNGDIIFAGTPPDIQDVFNILGLSKILRFAEDEKSALGLFGKR